MTAWGRPVRDLAEYLALRGFQSTLAWMPPWLGRSVAEVLGRLAYAGGVRRSVVVRQISAAFPGRPARWVRETAFDCYRHFSRELVPVARLKRLPPERLVERTRGTEAFLETYRRFVDPGEGAVVVTGHLGNWELAGVVAAGLGLPVTAVVKRQRNRRVDRVFHDFRARAGIEAVYMEEAPSRVPDALAEGRLVALVADQDAKRRGVFVPYLGRPASTFRGPARFALEGDVPLFFGAMIREKGGYRIFLEWVDRTGLDGGAPETDAGGGGRSDRRRARREADRELTRRWVRRLERAVRWWPGQYFWFHRRWKTRPEDAEL